MAQESSRLSIMSEQCVARQSRGARSGRAPPATFIVGVHFVATAPATGKEGTVYSVIWNTEDRGRSRCDEYVVTPGFSNTPIYEFINCTRATIELGDLPN